MLKLSKSKAKEESFDTPGEKLDHIVSQMPKENVERIPICKAIADYGGENIFVADKTIYNNCKYYNNVTGEFFLGGIYIKEVPDVQEGLDDDYIDRKLIYKNIYDKEKDKIDKLYFRQNDIDNNLDSLKGIIKITVKRGRKWKGTGYIIGQETSRYQYSAWNSSTTHYYKVYDDQNNTINTVNKDYADLKDAEDKFNEYKKYRLDLLNKSKESDIEFKDHEFILYTYDNFIDWLKNKYYDPSIDWSKATDIEQEKQNKKSEEFKKKKMPELIEWVKNNTDKKGDEIEKLAERIYNKRYG